MPTHAFEKLSDDKKQILLDAALKEFSQNSYDRVSVFKIAQNAGVSRSGLYYYFAGKEDIYAYLLSRLKMQLDTLFDREQDVFEMPMVMFDFFASFKGTNMQRFIQRMLENMKPSVQNELNPIKEHGVSTPRMHGFKNLEQLKISDEDDFRIMGFMVMNCVMASLRGYFDFEMELETVRKRLNRSLDFIKYGVLKEKENCNE